METPVTMGQREVTRLRNTVETLKEEKKTWTQEKKVFLEEKKDLQRQISERDAQISELKDERTGKNRKGGGRKGRKSEQKDDVKDMIKAYVKDVLFRTVKFAQPGTELYEATQKVWLGIKDKNKLDRGPDALDMDNFIEIYESEVLTQLSGSRQYTQTRAHAAAKGKKFQLFNSTLHLRHLTLF